MPVVTFTTDFGTRDGYAGAMKGIVLQHAPNAVLVDITHEVPRHDVAAGAFTLAQATPHFPRGTIHVAVVDPGVGGDRLEVVVESQGAVFVGPDNGLLSLAAPAPRVVYRIENPAFRRHPVSATFHGRDVFAPTAGRLAAGQPAHQAGSRQEDIAALAIGAAGSPGDASVAEVIHVDAFGNLVTSWEGEPDRTGRWDLEVEGRRIPLSMGSTFSDVEPGAVVLYRGSGEWIEVASRDGSAAALTGAARGTTLRLRRRP